MIRLALLSILLLCYPLLQAQNSSGVTTFRPFSSEKPATPEKEVKGLENQIMKCHTFLLVRGAFVLGYERNLNDAFSLEAQLGMTYRDFLFELMHDGVGFGEGMEENIESFGGPYLGLAGRYYFNHVFSEGGYIGAVVRNRNYHMKIKTDDALLTRINLNYQMTEFGVFLGYQYEGYYTDAIYELYIGPAISWARYDSFSTTNPGEIEVSRQNVQYPVILFGFNIGFPF